MAVPPRDHSTATPALVIFLPRLGPGCDEVHRSEEFNGHADVAVVLAEVSAWRVCKGTASFFTGRT